MYTVLMLNQKGGVGKTTLADEIAFALERRGKSVAFVSTDPQGGQVHELCTDPFIAEESDFQIVDTAGVVKDSMGDWCVSADLILVPVLPSTRDIEPTMRTLDIVQKSKTRAETMVIVNTFYAYGKMDRQLVEFFEESQIPILAKVPRAAAFSQAAARGKSIVEYDQRSHAVPVLEYIADCIIDLSEKENGR